MTSAENFDEGAESRLLPHSAEGGRQRLLLVDDDPNFRMVVYFTLNKLGYLVAVAGGAEEAMKIAVENKNIQLLITDVTMPGMNGVELAERILEIQPRVKVMFISGFPLRMVARAGVNTDSVNFLQKPFPPALLEARIKAILAGG
jgi:DNA-binding response OmpR family regulator